MIDALVGTRGSPQGANPLASPALLPSELEQVCSEEAPLLQAYQDPARRLRAIARRCQSRCLSGEMCS